MGNQRSHAKQPQQPQQTPERRRSIAKGREGTGAGSRWAESVGC